MKPLLFKLTAILLLFALNSSQLTAQNDVTYSPPLYEKVTTEVIAKPSGKWVKVKSTKPCCPDDCCIIRMAQLQKP